MDDLLFSVPLVDEAIDLSKNVASLLKNRGFHLSKWVSNRNAVVEALGGRSEVHLDLSLNKLPEPSKRILGVRWSTIGDCFKFDIQLRQKSFTRRGLLSILSSIFDPLGFVAPLLLSGKLLLQDLCRRKLGWDELVADEDVRSWERWLETLSSQQQLEVPRCLSPPGVIFTLCKCELHHFCDASNLAYSVVSYVRIVAPDGAISCKFIFGKSRLAPLKTLSIPKLELVAATLAARSDAMIKRELVSDEMVLTSTFWTDSMVVLYMLKNSSKRFPVFVSNRLSQIEEASSHTQWRFVASKQNPADDGTRVSTLFPKRWLTGPSFLLDSELTWPKPPCVLPDLPAEFDLNQKTVAATQVEEKGRFYSMDERFSRFSSFFRLKKAAALILRLRDKLLKRPVLKGSPTVDELERVENALLITTQREFFERDYIKICQASEGTLKASLMKLNPVCVAGLLRVGGRLRRASYPYDVKHPIILPSGSHVTRLIIEEYHNKVGHSGASHTWSSLRQRFWILKGAGTVRKILNLCLFCKRRNSSFGKQFMADLPECRITAGKPAFYFTGIDYFGPVMVKQGRSCVKRYGCIFTCLTMRAVHLELGFSLDTDSFINALRRFICRRGTPHTFFSDNGSNLVGGCRELRRSLHDLDQTVIEKRLKQHQIRWKFNPPYASHMGGIWERVVRTVKRVLYALSTEQIVTDDILLTLFSEAEHIVNSRPLTPIVIDPTSEEPLTPNHLLTLQSSSVPIGVFDQKDNFVRKRWRQAQFLAEQFWSRWRKEYLQTLQVRQKWQKVQPNFAVDDVVLLSDQDSVPRGKWPLGRVIDTFPDDRGVVRQVLVRTSNKTVKRPITKLCKLSTENTYN